VLQNSFLKSLKAGSHTLTALFNDENNVDVSFKVVQVTTYKVTFNSNGIGMAPDAGTVEDGKKAEKPANPTASGYTFGGWYTEKECINAFDFNTPITKDITLYAKWTKISSGGNNSTNEPGKGGETNQSPARTGDDNNTGLWMMMMVISVLVIGSMIVVLYRRRRRESDSE